MSGDSIARCSGGIGCGIISLLSSSYSDNIVYVIALSLLSFGYLGLSLSLLHVRGGSSTPHIHKVTESRSQISGDRLQHNNNSEGDVAPISWPFEYI